VERQKLTSLLNDNLHRRRLELMEGIAGNEEGESRRRSRGRVSSAAAQSQLKEDLEERQRQLDNATQTKDDIETRVEESRAIEEELRGELISAKNKLEQLRSQDMKDMKVLEEAQDKSERLLTKVRRHCCRFSMIFKVVRIAHSLSFFLPLETEIHVRFETRDLHAEDPRTGIASTAFGT
jgi:DNA repair exonuclease SbcCD ATPase subunit